MEEPRFVDPALVGESCVPITWEDEDAPEGPEYKGGAPHPSGFSRAERRKAYKEHRRQATKRVRR